MDGEMQSVADAPTVASVLAMARKLSPEERNHVTQILARYNDHELYEAMDAQPKGFGIAADGLPEFDERDLKAMRREFQRDLDRKQDRIYGPDPR